MTHSSVASCEAIGVVQPRVGVSLPSAHRSRFAAIYSGHPGVDPYTTAVSDVYQDLFGEGSFTGKGIYDVAAYETATHGRFPENALLSHDLIEGSYVRAALATDITVYDDYPGRYLTFTRRKHRWIRGDWQLLRWLTLSVPGPQGMEPNRLSLLSRWKLLDNLRRSVVEIAQLALLVAGWTVLPGSPFRWTALALGAIAGPWIFSLLLAVLRPPFDKSWRAYYGAIGRDAVTSVQQLALAIVFLPHQAIVSADAIGRTLWRLGLTRRHLLEWQTSSQSEREVATGAGAAWRAMWPAVALATIVLGIIALGTFGYPTVARSWLLAVVLPLVAAWCLSPTIAYALSKPASPRRPAFSPDERTIALRYARAHWQYFDTFVTASTNWLAPDNFQDDPAPEIGDAHVADQHRAAAAVDRERVRPRLHYRRRHGAAPRAGAAVPRTHAPLSRPFLQLVRPARSARARAALHLHGGQRATSPATSSPLGGRVCEMAATGDRRGASAGRRRPRLRLRDGDGLPLPVRPEPEAVRHRLSAECARARPVVLRSPRVGGAARELRRHREGRCAGRALVSPRAHAHARHRARRRSSRGAGACSSI